MKSDTACSGTVPLQEWTKANRTAAQIRKLWRRRRCYPDFQSSSYIDTYSLANAFQPRALTVSAQLTVLGAGCVWNAAIQHPTPIAAEIRLDANPPRQCCHGGRAGQGRAPGAASKLAARQRHGETRSRRQRPTNGAVGSLLGCQVVTAPGEQSLRAVALRRFTKRRHRTFEGLCGSAP